jgi:hypothetical protein
MLLFWASARGADIPGEYTAYPSPSGRVIAKVGIAGAEASPSTRFRIRLVFDTITKERIGEVWTGLRQHWAATWFGDDVFVVCGINEEADGNPMEFYGYDFSAKGKGGGKVPTAAEREAVMLEYRRKYPGHAARPNQLPEPTTMAVTLRADARPAPAIVVAHR